MIEMLYIRLLCKEKFPQNLFIELNFCGKRGFSHAGISTKVSVFIRKYEIKDIRRHESNKN